MGLFYLEHILSFGRAELRPCEELHGHLLNATVRGS